MSKAFLRESDDAVDEPVLRPLAPLAPGQKNYLTPEGAQRLRDELSELLASRAPLLAQPDSSDAKRELQQIAHRIRQVEQSLRAGEIISSPKNPDSVEFGSYVTVRDSHDDESLYRIVGPDEADAGRGWISHQSPLARGLLGAAAGQSVTIQTPRGPAALKIIAITGVPTRDS